MGSAPASDNLLDTLATRFPDAKLNLNYGITEGGPILFSWSHPDGLPRPRTSVGFPIEGVEIKLIDGPSESQGVLCVKSPGVMEGYHNLPEATESVLSPDGWMNTGDILRRDENGWYFFVDRADDMFVCAGENIYPGDVESMLERNEEVMQAVVVPAPNTLKAHVPFAWIGGIERPTLIAELLQEVNTQRELNGKQPLRLNSRLTAAAQKHAKNMSENDFFDHLSPDGRGVMERVTEEGYYWRAIAENIGAGLSLPKSMLKAWMSSRDHQNNLLSSEFDDIGICYFQPIQNETMPTYAHYWVVVFGKRSQ